MQSCRFSISAVECDTNFVNTPVIIKYVFHALTLENPYSVYACINKGEAYAPQEIADRSIVIDGDTGEVIRKIL